MQELEKQMYYGASPMIFERAFRLRRIMTHTEELLWNKLCKKQICNLRFRRQHPISRYIVDFYCHSAKLVVELDGKIHLGKKESDMKRTIEIESFGIQVIRFTNEEVEKDINSVVEQITGKVKRIISADTAIR